VFIRGRVLVYQQAGQRWTLGWLGAIAGWESCKTVLAAARPCTNSTHLRSCLTKSSKADADTSIRVPSANVIVIATSPEKFFFLQNRCSGKAASFRILRLKSVRQKNISGPAVFICVSWCLVFLRGLGGE
jgi:hypothetical protein